MRTVSFDGFGSDNITFLSALTSADQGKPVKMSASKTVAVAADGNAFTGKAIKVEKDGAVDVQYTGYVEFVYSGTAPSAGYAKLAADAAGGVKIDNTNGREYLVVMVDTAAKIVGFFLK